MAQSSYVILKHIDSEKFYKFLLTPADMTRVNRLYNAEQREEYGDLAIVYEISKRVKGPNHELPLFEPDSECFMDHWQLAYEEYEDDTEFEVVSPLVWKESSPEA